jgi:enoyl-CoA hydratase/carnithine racemase
MTQCMRQPTLETLGLGSVIDIFKNGRLPAGAGEMVDAVFGPKGQRGSLVVSGANGVVGAGKTMQLGSRLLPYDVRVVALDFPGTPDGLGKQYPGLVRAFGKDSASAIMANIIKLTYDGKSLPPELKGLNPRYLLEAIPEVLEIKKAHYELFRAEFPEIQIRSVTSGFPSSELGVGIAHPAFPHEINKVWEIVEESPSDITKLKWALGLQPVPVVDYWSFVLDVLFCGITLAGTRYHEASNMPYWKIDKYVRQVVGPNPFRAHDAIGAKGANFLTWSCLHHLGEQYGDLFKPTTEMNSHKEQGTNWYPPDHFRPLVDWSLDGEERDEMKAWLLGPIFQMTSLMLHEKRAHLTHMNSIGELCAQFRRGVLAMMRDEGPDSVIKTVETYHGLHAGAAGSAWHPEALSGMDSPEWQQLYVNAEHDGEVGVITLARESYNRDVDAELNRAIDWLKAAKIDRVILTGDFHLSTQLVGADTSEFFPALDDVEAGMRVSGNWSRTARRMHDDFKVSVGYIGGKRCLGGMLELMLHCHVVAAVDGASLGFPEVTLPVVPGMEGCHWPFRKTGKDSWPKLVHLLLDGGSVRAKDAAGWLIDAAGPQDELLATVWKAARSEGSQLKPRSLETGALSDLPPAPPTLSPGADPGTEAARKAILDCVKASCAAPLAEALEIQSRHSSEFMTTRWCRKGTVGAEAARTEVA